MKSNNRYEYHEYLVDTKVRELCCEREWFTRGTNKDYDEMFDLIRLHKHNPEINDIYCIASDIFYHSNFTYLLSQGYTPGDCMALIMTELIERCISRCVTASDFWDM